MSSLGNYSTVFRREDLLCMFYKNVDPSPPYSPANEKTINYQRFSWKMTTQLKSAIQCPYFGHGEMTFYSRVGIRQS